MRASHAAAATLLLCGLGARGADDTSPPVITHTHVARGDRGKPTVVTARITDESKIFPQVFFRFGSSGAYEKPLDMKPVKGQKAQWTATLPAPPANVLEYYIEAYDEFGNGPARAGDPEKPFRIDFAPVQIVQTPPAAPAAAAAAASPAPAAQGGRTWTWIVGGTGLGLLIGGIVANPLGSPRATALDVAGATLLAGGVALYFIEAPRQPASAGPREPHAAAGMAFRPVSGGGALSVGGRF
ncbi:MAG TPA: hypothetical protein VG496_20340 [Myxococcales bacterium]|nr:hypothetical protein [Myxococcales bacterium]